MAEQKNNFTAGIVGLVLILFLISVFVLLAASAPSRDTGTQGSFLDDLIGKNCQSNLTYASKNCDDKNYALGHSGKKWGWW